jgi:hypothetical protein
VHAPFHFEAEGSAFRALSLRDRRGVFIEKHHAEPGQRVRGIIAAREIAEDLKTGMLILAKRIALRI